mgnify:CR=1 FL=1
MKFHTSFFVAAAAFIPATSSYADVTPQEVWAHAQLSAKSMGHTLSGRLEHDGDMLVVHDVKIEILGMNSDLMTFAGSLPKMVLKPLSGGTVELTVPEPTTYTVTMAGHPSIGMDAIDIVSSMTMDNAFIVSGSADDLAYEMLPGTIAYVTQKQVKDGLVVVPEQIITLLGAQGDMTYAIDEGRIATVMDFRADAVTSQSNGTTDEITMETVYKAAPLQLNADFMAQSGDQDAPLDYLKTLTGQAQYTIGNLTAETTAGTAAQMMHILAESQETTLIATIADGSFNYSGSVGQTEVALDGSAIPFPNIDFGIEKTTIGLTMPFVQSDAPAAFGTKLAIENLRLPDIAWMMLDPAGQMPHDPATLKLDISGDMILDVDLFNPQSMMNLDAGDLPVFPQNFTLNELFLSVAGATLSGTGAATVVAPEKLAGAQLPFQTGQATLALTGGTALINTLEQSGLVPPQMSATAKMMLTIFARPGEDDDSYISDIELSEQGALTVNGQPMPF